MLRRIGYTNLTIVMAAKMVVGGAIKTVDIALIVTIICFTKKNFSNRTFFHFFPFAAADCNTFSAAEL